jgi:hypothetical protein
MNFDDPKLAVFVCSHVFKNERAINLVSHENGEWQFMCGMLDHGDGDGHVIGLEHLLCRDPSLRELSDLPADWEAEREQPSQPWIKTMCNLHS